MLQRLRTKRPARLVLIATAALAIAGSLGLHPEPSERAPGVRRAATGIALQSAPTVSSRHDCVACLAHASVSIVRAAPLSFVLSPIGLLRPADPVRRAAALALGNHSGRAPPAAS